VGDLLRVSPEEAVSQLRYAGITVEMLSSWQAQALLVCRIPRLRPYDALVLVACGIRTPEQLRRTTPRELRDIVRAFAASSEGQAVLLSGTEYELSRVTEWISAAQEDRDRAAARQDERPLSRPSRVPSSRHATRRGQARKEPDSVPHHRRPQHPDRKRSQTASSRRSERESIIKLDDRTGWRFYLDRSADVVDAPSIGPRTAEKLIEIGIRTVDDLLKADPITVAEKLKNRRMNANTIEQWQQQTTLACRVPQLRGHDAQILVALGITDPQTLAQADVETLWAKVAPFVDTKEGKRIIRNGKEPDLNEVQDWIRWAQAARALHAA
jgi:hypothetical protein